MRIYLNSFLIFLFSLFSSNLFATLDDSMAQTGFSGLLRIPHAETLFVGDFSLNHHWESSINYTTHNSHGAHNTFLLGVGLLPGLEFTFQSAYKKMSDGPEWSYGHASDLSFSAKYDFKPFLPAHWFSFALGVQDYGGAAAKHHNRYLVASKSLFPNTYYQFRLTAGYGQGSLHNQMGDAYLAGPFAGVEWQPLPWVQLIAEQDGTGINSGIKLFTDDNWLPAGWKANLTYQSYSSSLTYNRDNQWVGLGLTLPLAVGVSSTRYTTKGVDESAFTDEPLMMSEQDTQKVKNTVSTETATLPSAEETAKRRDKTTQEKQLLSVLIDYGFENVRIGWDDKMLVVALENNLFNWNELDGIGVALGLIVNNTQATRFKLQLLNNQIEVLNIEGNTQQFADFLNQTPENPIASHGLIVSNQSFHKGSTLWADERKASSHFVPRFIFAPHLKSAVGTEYGVFDYSLALSSNLQMSLWQGSMVDIRHLLPVAHSDSYEDDEYFANSRHKNEVDRILFHQAFNLPLGLSTQFSGGQILKNYVGGLNEIYWQSTQGVHRFKSKVAHFKHRETENEYQLGLLSYRYHLRALDLDIESTYGQFWGGDIGGSLSFKQWFGDMAVKLTYENTTCDKSNAASACARDWMVADHEYAGLNFTFPFGPRKNASPAIGLQVKTLDRWGYGVRTRINHHHNYIGGSRSVNLTMQYNIEQQYYNRGRLSATHLESNVQRLRESYLKYAK